MGTVLEATVLCEMLATTDKQIGDATCRVGFVAFDPTGVGTVQEALLVLSHPGLLPLQSVAA
jgi:hypothetical protein